MGGCCSKDDNFSDSSTKPLLTSGGPKRFTLQTVQQSSVNTSDSSNYKPIPSISIQSNSIETKNEPHPVQSKGSVSSSLSNQFSPTLESSFSPGPTIPSVPPNTPHSSGNYSNLVTQLSQVPKLDDLVPLDESEEDVRDLEVDPKNKSSQNEIASNSDPLSAVTDDPIKISEPIITHNVESSASTDTFSHQTISLPDSTTEIALPTGNTLDILPPTEETIDIAGTQKEEEVKPVENSSQLTNNLEDHSSQPEPTSESKQEEIQGEAKIVPELAVNNESDEIAEQSADLPSDPQTSMPPVISHSPEITVVSESSETVIVESVNVLNNNDVIIPSDDQPDEKLVPLDDTNVVENASQNNEAIILDDSPHHEKSPETDSLSKSEEQHVPLDDFEIQPTPNPDPESQIDQPTETSSILDSLPVMEPLVARIPTRISRTLRRQPTVKEPAVKLAEARDELIKSGVIESDVVKIDEPISSQENSESSTHEAPEQIQAPTKKKLVGQPLDMHQSALAAALAKRGGPK